MTTRPAPGRTATRTPLTRPHAGPSAMPRRTTTSSASPPSRMQVAGDVRAQAEDRADRQVDLAHDQHERLADREHADDRRVEQQVAQRVGLDEALFEDAVPRAAAQRDDEPSSRTRRTLRTWRARDAPAAGAAASAALTRPPPAGRGAHDALLVASARLSSCTSRPRASRARGRPCRAPRAARWRSSARRARGGELADQPVHLGLRADVDAARRLVDDEQLRVGRQPLGEHDLLLVAARQRCRPGRSSRWTSAAAAPPIRAPSGARAPARISPSRRERPQPVERRVARDRQVHDQALLAAVLGHERDAGAHRGAGAAGAAAGAPATSTCPASGRSIAEDRPHDLAAAGADEPGERDDLAGADLEGDVEETPSRVRRSTSSTGARRPRRAAWGTARSSSRPTISRTSSSGVMSATGASCTTAPSRMTVTVSQSTKTSSRRWEMNRTARRARAARGRRRTAARPPARQRGGRLVHDDHARVEGERLGDLDDLLVGDREAADRRSASSLTPSRSSSPCDLVVHRPRGRSAARAAAAGGP